MSIFTGTKELLESPSGVFGLLCLFAITFVTLKVPSVGSYAFAAFVAVVPAILAFCEHKETLASMTGIAPPPPPPPPPPPVVDPTPTVQPSDLPVKGQL